MSFRKLAVISIFILELFVAFQLSRSIVGLWRGGGRVEELRREVKLLEEEKERLEAEKAYRQTSEFIEEQARNRLQMVKEGEHIVILPRSEGPEEIVEEVKGESNWKLWVDYWLD